MKTEKQTLMIEAVSIECRIVDPFPHTVFQISL
jgi:hypothetical protein